MLEMSFGGDVEIDAVLPFFERQPRILKGDAGPDAETPFAVAAAVRHGLRALDLVGVGGLAVPAAALLGPVNLLEPRAGSFLVGEQLAQLHQGDVLSMGLAGVSGLLLGHVSFLTFARKRVHQRGKSSEAYRF